ncbi:DUF2813 domain-containing protein [bacterium M00.F.Ca.ET.230.01.1.1]|nr:DUF2813 domain-containing protein [bacterium M00.F.Ca.ET.230.01.1.1]
MELLSIRIKNFRSISQEQNLDLLDRLTIVGSNSTGKTNILKAIEMFFTGVDNIYNYSIDEDFPFSIKDEKTSLIATFSIIENEDKEFLEVYEELNNMLESPKEKTGSISLYLNFSKGSNPYYSFFPNEKRKKSTVQTQFSKKQIQATKIVLDKFVCHYVPSSKSIKELYGILLLPFIKKYISNILQDKFQDITTGLNSISEQFNKQIENAGISAFKTHLEIPTNIIEGMLSSFELKVEDNFITSIDKKGMGIQATTILSSFYWITEEETKLDKKIIWLIEEPESYLHPELANSCFKILDNLKNKSKIVITTHSLGFVGQNPKQIIGTVLENNFTKIIKFDSYQKATDTIRKNLGVKFSDFYNLNYYNVFMEGKSDREVFSWVLESLSPSENEDFEWEKVRKSSFLDFTGTTSLESFLSMAYEFINKERIAVSILDGDDAGIKAIKALSNKFGNQKISFHANEDYILLPNKLPLEGLFPQAWLQEIYENNENWFNSFIIDVENKISDFKIKDNHKEQVRRILIQKSEKEVNENSNYDWAKNFILIFNTLEKAIDNKEKLFISKGYY